VNFPYRSVKVKFHVSTSVLWGWMKLHAPALFGWKLVSEYCGHDKHRKDREGNRTIPPSFSDRHGTNVSQLTFLFSVNLVMDQDFIMH